MRSKNRELPSFPLRRSIARKYLLSLCITLAIALPAADQQKEPPPPPWAYPVAAPDYRTPVDDGTPRHVPGSSASWTLTQVGDYFFAPDWHPEDHPGMPEVVAHGRKPDVYACGFCISPA